MRLSEAYQYSYQGIHYIRSVLMAVAFGDRPSGAIATLALRQTATMYQHIYPDASKMVIRNSYVDDILQSSLTALYILEKSPAKAVCVCLKRISTAIKAFIIFDPFVQ
jgi:hypothetical protein